MSWLTRELAIALFKENRPFQGDIEWSEFREAIGLRWYLGRKDDRLASEDLGFRIDDCLVEYIGCQLSRLKQGEISKEEFELAMQVADLGIREDPDLNAYEATLLWDGQPKLASGIYLYLARRLVLQGKTRPPLPPEGDRFARVFLDAFRDDARWSTGWDKDKARWSIDWDIDSFSRSWADSLWREPDPDDLHKLIEDSPRNAAAWDTLVLMCKDAADRGIVDLMPSELIRWRFMASEGQLMRPGVAKIPRNRPKALAYRFRNNEIRHTLRLLELVGVPEKAGEEAVAKAFDLAVRTIHRNSRKPYWTLEDVRKDVQKRLQPPKKPFISGPDSNSVPTG